MADAIISTTVNVGVLYEGGVVLMTDSQATAGTKCIGDVQKIFHLADNALMSVSGDLGYAQKTMQGMQTDIVKLLAFYDQAVRNREKETIEQMRQSIRKEGRTEEDMKKERDIEALTKTPFESKRIMFSKSEFYVNLSGDTLYISPDIKRELDGAIKQKEGHYVMQVVEQNLLFEVGSVVSNAARKMNDAAKVLTGIVIGYDKSGPRLFEMYSNAAFIERKDYGAMGSGAYEASSLLREYHSKKISRDTAIMLSIYSGLRAAEKDTGINDNFQVAFIEKTSEGKIQPSLLSSTDIKIIKKRLRGIKPRLPF